MSTALLHTRTVVRSGVAVVYLSGELDLDTAPGVRATVTLCLDRRPEQLRIDLTEVVFCDCAGLNALLGARLAALRAGAEMYVTGVGSQVARLFDLSGAGKVLACRAADPAPPDGTGGAAQEPPEPPAVPRTRPLP
ncbi:MULTISPECIES: STAS domain-containing protein [Streptomyces]|uniref:Anti-sigma factor antagonist n=1 Tax=Streptomyces lycii TaxID=2654337 RepID=A0ABQ7FKG9_9ACTN|nr:MULTISPECIES: STAS domain-containing protein [Streptomyces]KAF4407722.1 STAS domain-containing protein [Streptomyces lycii]PGH51520.1 anti-anti-sigma factor [Streptomyces sp. Ru87]